MRDNIKSALGRHFLPSLRNDRRLVGLHLRCDADDLVGNRQLQVELDRDGFPQDAQIAVLNMTAVLPKDLPVASAVASGVPVVIGARASRPAIVRLAQGPVRRPRVSVTRRIRLKAPGPVEVTFQSPALVTGPYRVTISVAGKVVRTVGGRLVR